MSRALSLACSRCGESLLIEQAARNGEEVIQKLIRLSILT